MYMNLFSLKWCYNFLVLLNDDLNLFIIHSLLYFEHKKCNSEKITFS